MARRRDAGPSSWTAHKHVADTDAYRRDRRKDRVLQENGYLVLRFLAEDVGKELNAVLGAIRRSLAYGQRRLDGLS